MSKNYATAPLPFQGQKRNFVKQFKEALKTYPDDAIYVDLFGGSGLLSHTVKQQKPNVKVIYNDYDNFKERLKSIPETNKLLSKIRALVEHIPNKKAITDNIRYRILDVITEADKRGYVDYITLSASLLFSMNYVQNLEELKKQRFYNRVRKSDYNASSYLSNVDFVRYDYK